MPSRAAHVVHDERHVRARVARDEIVERMRDRIGERGRAARPGSRRRARRAGAPHPRPRRGARRRGCTRRSARSASIHAFGSAAVRAPHLVVVERTEVGEQVVQVVGVAGLTLGNEPLELELQLARSPPDRAARAAPRCRADHGADRDRARAPRRGARRAARRPRTCTPRSNRTAGSARTATRARVSTGTTRTRAGTDVGEHLAQRGKVEDVAQALTRRFEQDREGRVAGRDLEEPGRALALLPERRALAGPAAGEQQRARRVLAEMRREQRRGRHAGDHELVELVGVDEQDLERDLLERFRKPADDAVVGPQHLHGQVERGPGAPRSRAPTARGPARRTA